jgi:hypothetical protein
MPIPPSALPGISPTRGEISRWQLPPISSLSVRGNFPAEHGLTTALLADLPPCGGLEERAETRGSAPVARQGRGGCR